LPRGRPSGEATAEDNHGQLVRFSWRSVPGGVLTEHVLPHQEERFTILAGQARFTLAGEELVAGAGETVVVPAGVRSISRAISALTGGRPVGFG
jgi:quercetin dioxygenase-like cupin family protein